MARPTPQSRQKREREQARLEKRERKQEKKAAAAAARTEQPAGPDSPLPVEDAAPELGDTPLDTDG